MTTFLSRLSDISDLLYLPRFIPTFRAVLLQPVRFFSHYRDIVTNEQVKFFDLHFERHDDTYLGPVKFSAIVVCISNILFPLILQLGVVVGAFSRDFFEFAQWAKEAGYLDPLSITGLSFIDEPIRKILLLAFMYLLGVLVWLFAKRKIPISFAAGYLFYIGAWDLVSILASMAFILVSFIIPLYQTGLPQIVDTIIYCIFAFMFLAFPIIYWPKILGLSRQRIAISWGIGLTVWIIVIVVVFVPFINMPQF